MYFNVNFKANYLCISWTSKRLDNFIFSKSHNLGILYNINRMYPCSERTFDNEMQAGSSSQYVYSLVF
jgi:hypothetical protein